MRRLLRLSSVGGGGTAGSASGQQVNVEEVGRISLPPVPPESPPGLVSDLQVANGFAYVGRYVDVPARVEVFDVRVPSAPTGPICQTAEPSGSEVEDLVIEDRFLYVASQDASGDIDGVQVHDLIDLDAPSCTGAAFFVPGIPSAHDLFLYTHSNGMRLLLVATLQPDASRGVHVLNVDNPGSPVSVAFIPHPLPPTAFCAPAPGFPCGPHDIYAQLLPSGQDVLVVAGLSDGSYIFDITIPSAPVQVGHFGYMWRTPDGDADGVADCCDLFGDGACDDTNFDGTVDDLDKTFLNNTHDARITPDGQYLWTADEKACGGHVITWSLADILSQCGDADGCPPGLGEMVPLGEYWLDTPMPVTVHQIRWYSSNYALLPWYEEGLRVLGITDDATAVPNPATDPIEVGYFDSLVPNTDGCIDNGVPPVDCVAGNPDRVLNPGFGGDWGVVWDDCYLYISDRGSPDNNEAPPSDAGTEGALIVLRYTGGPTTPQPLRITKDQVTPGDLVASWGEVPFASTFNLYRGTLPDAGGNLATLGTRPPGAEYDHTMIGPFNCDAPGSPSAVFGQFTPGVEGPTYYYLVTARSPCDDAEDREGNYGQDSFDVDRPVAATTCPL